MATVNELSQLQGMYSGFKVRNSEDETVMVERVYGDSYPLSIKSDRNIHQIMLNGGVVVTLKSSDKFRIKETDSAVVLKFKNKYIIDLVKA